MNVVVDFVFVIGSDLVENLENWQCKKCDGYWEEIQQAGVVFVAENNFLVIRRPGSDLTSELPPQFQLITPATEGATLVTTTLSSTEVRRRIQGGSEPHVPRRRESQTNGVPRSIRFRATTTTSATTPTTATTESTATMTLPEKKARPNPDHQMASAATTPDLARERSADEVVRRRMAVASIPRRSRYRGAEGLVPSSVLGHIIRYDLYPPE